MIVRGLYGLFLCSYTGALANNIGKCTESSTGRQYVQARIYNQISTKTNTSFTCVTICTITHRKFNCVATYARLHQVYISKAILRSRTCRYVRRTRNVGMWRSTVVITDTCVPQYSTTYSRINFLSTSSGALVGGWIAVGLELVHWGYSQLSIVGLKPIHFVCTRKHINASSKYRYMVGRVGLRGGWTSG